MDEFAVARAVHVVAVVVWIGGVSFVTTVLLPAIGREVEPGLRVSLFERVEARFAWQARVTTLIAGVSGLWLTVRWQLWSRFVDAGFWWMHAMVAVWALFTLMLFVLEPIFLHRWFSQRALRDPEGTFTLVRMLHRVLLAVSLVTVAAATLGAHGGLS